MFFISYRNEDGRAYLMEEGFWANVRFFDDGFGNSFRVRRFYTYDYAAKLAEKLNQTVSRDCIRSSVRAIEEITKLPDHL